MKTYQLFSKKRRLQVEVYSLVKNRRIVALAGPNAGSYAEFLKVCGFKEIIFYESDFMTYQNQKTLSGVTFRYGNILDNLTEDAFYDIDLMCNANTLEKSGKLEEINKIKEYFLTLALRPISGNKTKEILNKYIGNAKHAYTNYKDTSQMITLLKI